jgi:hypothetical protein
MVLVGWAEKKVHSIDHWSSMEREEQLLELHTRKSSYNYSQKMSHRRLSGQITTSYPVKSVKSSHDTTTGLDQPPSMCCGRNRNMQNYCHLYASDRNYMIWKVWNKSQYTYRNVSNRIWVNQWQSPQVLLERSRSSWCSWYFVIVRSDTCVCAREVSVWEAGIISCANAFLPPLPFRPWIL